MSKARLQAGILLTGLFILLVIAAAQPAHAIPAFARKYGTSCATCHSDFPKLNDFGKAFKDAGFKFPKDDEDFIKVPPTLLGAPAQKEMFPHTIWPGRIDGMPPIGLRFNTYFQVTGKNRGNFQYVPNGNTPPYVPNFIPRTDFQSGLFSIFTAGDLGDNIAFWVDDDLSVAGSNAAGGLGDGYLKFVDIGHLLHLPKDALSLRVGQFELDLPFSQARSYNISGWDIYSQFNLGAMDTFLPSQQQNVANGFSMDAAGQGIEISGGHTYGGYHYSLAVINQTTGTQPIETAGYVSSPTGFVSDANFKDIYGRFAYRFNLDRDKASRHEIQAAGPTGPRDHTSLTLGTYYFYGRSVQRLIGTNLSGTTPVLLTAREPFYRVGGDFNFIYHNFNLYGLYMFGHDNNLIPAAGGVPVFPAVIVPTGFYHGPAATFSGGFLQADYMPYPWLMLIMRYDGVNSTSDRINGLGFNTDAPYIIPYASTRNRFTPGVQFLIHANIKASFEYQIRPQQAVINGIDPITGATVNIPHFRTNTPVVALEWVY
jgi:hypothetical protein